MVNCLIYLNRRVSVMTSQSPHLKQPTHRDELQQRNCLGSAGVGGGGREAKSVLPARNRISSI